MKLVLTVLMMNISLCNGQNSILKFADNEYYELSIPFEGDTILHLPEINLPEKLGLNYPTRTISDERGISKVYYKDNWRIIFHQFNSKQRNGTTISRIRKS